MPSFEPFRVDVPDRVLDDLHDRLRRTRFPNAIDGSNWDQGTDLAYLRELVTYWVDRFDWRAQEARINAFDQLTTAVDGQRIHLVHARSPEPDALPLLLVHGWPGSIIEFLDVLGPLTDPVAHGGDPADAFHVVAPSLPGYTFSGPTSEPGWHPRRIAEAFVEIMDSLGYDRYGAQGGDWGSIVTANVADLAPDHVAGLHLNFVVARAPKGDAPPLTDTEVAHLEAMSEWRRTGAGYQEIQGTRAAEPRLRTRGLPRRAGRVDRREVPRLERLRRRHRAVVHEGSAAHEHHGVLGHRHGHVVGAALPRDAPGRPRGHAARLHHHPDRRRRLRR